VAYEVRTYSPRTGCRITNRGPRAPLPYKESGHKLTSAQAIGSQAS
jgi:hypothetical protein